MLFGCLICMCFIFWYFLFFDFFFVVVISVFVGVCAEMNCSLSRNCIMFHLQSYCYKGMCNTHNRQCQLLWGNTGRVSDPICYQQLNMHGNHDGNCGYNWTTEQYKTCEREYVLCEIIHNIFSEMGGFVSLSLKTKASASIRYVW